MADSGFKAREKYPGFNENKTILYNSGSLTSAYPDWNRATTGAWFLNRNVTNSALVIPITGLREGDILINYRVVGAIGGEASATSVLNASFESVTKGTGSVTTAVIGAMTTNTAAADAALDEETSLSEEVVATDYQYYVVLDGTTADSASCDISINGIEVDIIRA